MHDSEKKTMYPEHLKQSLERWLMNYKNGNTQFSGRKLEIMRRKTKNKKQQTKKTKQAIQCFHENI